jgi:hypothetical protein
VNVCFARRARQRAIVHWNNHLRLEVTIHSEPTGKPATFSDFREILKLARSPTCSSLPRDFTFMSLVPTDPFAHIFPAFSSPKPAGEAPALEP